MIELNSKTGWHESDHLITKITNPQYPSFHCSTKDNKTIVESTKF